jgi:hypothetical protein
MVSILVDPLLSIKASTVLFFVYLSNSTIYNHRIFFVYSLFVTFFNMTVKMNKNLWQWWLPKATKFLISLWQKKAIYLVFYHAVGDYLSKI